ncbi:hypothetical protein [Candidatus Bathycorpusculum sp.]|uniref:hypothetical protein n=1 Tax=Candidatus Bathycorpusculum sp. TaxID=2994959 RepID=UPI00281A8DAE|nr:hypothetical protein [Candidatus Termitimicrobium sp.]MCL2686338.1 hypothetical protein [Candidatus Termitimicrobium sp.]
MKNNVQKILSIILVLALVAGCFATLPWTANATPTPVAGTPAWDDKYSSVAVDNQRVGVYYDRGNSAGDKISSNAHSGDYPGVYFRWDEKQKCPGVFLVADWVFDLFEGETFDLTAKNSNSYYKYTISRTTGLEYKVNGVGTGVYVYGIPKDVMAKDNKGNDKPDQLKNINMVFIDGNYKSAYFTIEKVWKDENGNIVTGDNSLVSFKENKAWTVDETIEVKITDYVTAIKGKKVTITENPIAGFTTEENPQSITVRYDDDPQQVVTFINQKQWAKIILEKVWLNVAGEEIAQPAGLSAVFNIVGASFSTSKLGVGVGTYEVKEGRYVITEKDIPGYDLVSVKVNDVEIENGAYINVVAGDKYTIAFTNKDPAEKYPIELFKTIDGTFVNPKLPDGYTLDIFLKEVIFTLYETDCDGGVYTRGVNGVPGVVAPNGLITFDAQKISDMQRTTRSTIDGWYVIVESYADGSNAEQIFMPAKPLYVYFDGKNIYSNVDTFDYDASYTIINGYTLGKFDWGYGPEGIGYEGLNGEGHIFYIGIKNASPNSEFEGKIYDSFCAEAGATHFAGESGLGCSGYLVVDRTQFVEYVDILFAYNYIFDNYGDLNDNRVITQVVTWAILGAVTSDKLDDTRLTDVEKEAIREVLENYKGYQSTKDIDELRIVDVVYLFCEDGHDSHSCQPQLVPVYEGKHVFINKLQEEFDVSFTKTKYGGDLPVAKGEFEFKLHKFNAETNDYDLFIGLYPTDEYGVVTAKLAPGSYVFTEVWTTVFDGGLGFDEEGNPVENYNLVWKAIYPGGADGLYFTIAIDGAVTWKYGDNTVDNEIYGKHNVLWAPDGYDPVALTLPHEYVIELGEGNGKIIVITNISGATMTVVGIVKPDCTRRGIVWLGCSDGTGTSIEFGEQLGHNFQPVAIAPGFGDGFVWFGCSNGCGGSYVEYNYDAWIALGGPP